MSSTNRGGKRSPADFYPTPAWCVHRLLDACELPPGRWLEPCAGEGSLIAAVDAHRTGQSWTAVELREDCGPALRGRGIDVHIGDFRTARVLRRSRFDVAITNPPYSCAQDIVDRARELADVVVMLLRLNFVATVGRAAFMRRHPPDVYVLPNRPSFTGRGMDSVEYAWFVWHTGTRRTSGAIRVLAPTPASERRAR